MRYLFICSLGPVQDFIRTARRSRDLWFGSWMLSELSKAAARAVAAQYGLEALIFPAPRDLDALGPGSRLNVANRIVAIVTEKNPEETAKVINSAVQERLEEIKKTAYARIGGPYREVVAEEQVNDLVEFYWSAVPFSEGQEYKDVRAAAERLLAARKNTRDFQQLEGSEDPKSSLDGNRESVILENQYPGRADPPNVYLQKTSRLYRNYGARPAERLSGVDLMKRLGSSPEEADLSKFYSTSHFAALPFMAMMDREKGQGHAQQLLKKIEQLYRQAEWVVADVPLDGALLYESRISDVVPRGKSQEDLQKNLANLLKEEVGEQKPSAYYALLRADGDNIGAVIDSQSNPEDHRKLSAALSAFAEEVPAIIKKHDGRAIFAGGEDILAYLPLHKALLCAEELEDKFRKAMMKENIKGKAQDDKDIFPTLSAGLVIAHHLTSLSEILALARNAEQEAKKLPEKNALVIVLNKRGGVDRVIKGRWQILNSRLIKLIAFYRQKAISRGTAYELQNLSNMLSGVDIDPEVLQEEALRIVERKKESDSEKAISSNLAEQFKIWLQIEKIPIHELAQEMIIAGIFGQALDTAIGKGQASGKVETT